MSQQSLFEDTVTAETVARADADALALLALFYFGRILDQRGVSIVVRHFEPLARFFEATETELKALFSSYVHLRGFVDAARLVDPKERRLAFVYAEKYRKLLTGQTPGQLLVSDHPDFPQGVRRASFPVLWLFFHPHTPAGIRSPFVSIIGSRQSSKEQLEAAAEVARGVADMGGTVITGLATGADEAAHSAAIARTPSVIAVLGSGIRRVYPANHKKLAHDLMARGGTIITEVPPDHPPNADGFVLRNRIVATLGHNVIAVSGKYASGTAHTIRFASDAGIPIFSVDPSPGSGISKLVQELGGRVTDVVSLFRRPASET